MALTSKEKEETLRLYQSGATYAEIARALGKTRDEVRNYLRRSPHYRPKTDQRGNLKPPAPSADPATDILSMIRHPTDRGLITTTLGITDRVLDAMLEDLTESGYLIEQNGSQVGLAKTTYADQPQEIDVAWEGNRQVRFGVIADNHINSKSTQITLLHEAYDRFVREGIKHVYNVGDIDEGEQMRKGHQYECYSQGADDHVDEIVRVYPKRKGVTTHFITGNHDASFIKLSGIDIGRQIANQRPDMDYLGQDDVIVNLTPGCRLEVMHPGGGSCFDDKTEIFTKRGWIPFSELTMDDEVATMTKEEHRFEWQKPTEITAEPYDGKMYHFKARCIDMMVTPNHGMWAKRSEKDKKPWWGKDLKYPKKARYTVDYSYRRYTAQELVDQYRRQKWQMTRVCDDWKGETPSEYVKVPYIKSRAPGLDHQMKHIGKVSYLTMAKFMAWYVTEGHVDRKTVSICQSKLINPENHKYILDIIDDMGLYACVTGREEKDICISSVELASFIAHECGKGSANKRLPEWVKGLPRKDLALVFDILIRGDGWVNGTGLGYRSISPRLLDDVSEVAFKLGYAVTRNGEAISITQTQVNPTITTRPTEHHYKGKIYCCSVPNGLILVQRHGKAIWSHNSYSWSYRPQKIAESLEGGTKPNVLLIGHYHKAEYLFYRNIHIVQAGTTQAQTPWMRSKALYASLGYWILELDVTDEGQVDACRSTFFPCYTPVENDYKNWREA